MPIKKDLNSSLDWEFLEKNLNPVYESLSRVQHDFYQHIFSNLPLTSDEVPLVLRTEHGYRDKFSTDINYHFYPWLFADMFPGLARKQLESICIVAQLFAESLVQMDKIIDHQMGNYSDIMQTLTILSSQYKLSRAVHLLSELFSADDPFWINYEALYMQYVIQVLGEKKNKSLDIPSTDTMEELAIGKVALTKIVTEAMAELTGRNECLPVLRESQDFFFVGYQLYDDVKDWRKDYEKEQYSYLLIRAFHEFDLVEEISSGRKPPSEVFGRYIHLSDILHDTLSLAATYYERARDKVASLQCHKWREWLQMQENNVLNLRNDLLDIRKMALERARGKATSKNLSSSKNTRQNWRTIFDKSIREGISFLQRQAASNYPEAGHLEMFSRRFTANGRSLCTWGTVFQRAVTLNTLVKARAEDYPFDSQAFDQDLRHLLALKLQDRKGGWSYFPEIKDLPPDCDDLAEVIHILWSCSHPAISELCDEPISLTLDMQGEDGGFSTWIVDPSDPDSVKMQSNMHNTWGARPDIEVMANFLYSLCCYDRQRFLDHILRGAEFVANGQNDDGSWTSTWYAGPYYGTWVSCRLMGALSLHERKIAKAIDFILSNQYKKGIWDMDNSAVLNTSYAMMTLANHAGRKMSSLLRESTKHLLNMQRDDGSWEGSDFIKMNTAKKSMISLPGFQEQYYKSDTMSTAFAVRALLTVMEYIFT